MIVFPALSLNNREQFTFKEGQKKLHPSEIVEHDHTYCLRPDTIPTTRNICESQWRGKERKREGKKEREKGGRGKRDIL